MIGMYVDQCDQHRMMSIVPLCYQLMRSIDKKTIQDSLVLPVLIIAQGCRFLRNHRSMPDHLKNTPEIYLRS